MYWAKSLYTLTLRIWAFLDPGTIHIYIHVCVCVCVCIHIENLGVSVPEDYTHVVQCQKRPTTVSKETYYSVKRDLLQCQKGPTTVRTIHMYICAVLGLF